MAAKPLMIGGLAFGVLVGLTAAALILAFGGGVMAALLAYPLAGSLGLLGMAATALWST